MYVCSSVPPDDPETQAWCQRRSGPAFAQMATVMANGSHRGTLTWLMAGLMALITLVACRNHVPVLHTLPSIHAGSDTAARRTVSGSVRGAQGTARTVEAVNVETNERHRATTNQTGGFSFRLSPGRYRVELALRDGEALVKEPGVINITDPATDAHADFIVGTGVGNRRVSRPRGPAYRTFDGLGQPIA
jgi:hypothetical protein